MATEACNLSDGRKIIGKDCQSQKFICRMDGLNKLICEIVKLRNETDKEIQEYCPRSESSSESSSSSHIDCALECETVGPEWMSQINVNDLDQDAYDLLELAELEACALYRKIKLFSKEEGCAPVPSSSSEDSSSSEGVVFGCGDLIEQTGSHTYKEFVIDITAGEGWVFLEYNTYGPPKKFVVTYNGADVINTNYVGNSAYDLDLFLATGEYTVGPAIGSVSFEKTEPDAQATVKVYSPVISGDVGFILHCPTESSSSSEPSSSESSSSSDDDPCIDLPSVIAIVSLCPEISDYYELNLTPWGQIDYGQCSYIGFPPPPPSSSSSLSSSESGSESSVSSSSSEPPSSSSSDSSSISSSISSSSSSSGDTSSGSGSSSGDPYETATKILYNEISGSWEIYHPDLGLIATKLGESPIGAYIFEEGPCEGQVIYLVDAS
jgi:hypothetical protein